MGSPPRTVALLGAHAQVAAGLAVDPGVEADPVADLARPLAVPGDVLAQVAVRLGGVVAEAAQHVDAHLLGLAVLGMAFVGGEQLAGHVLALVAELDVPGLVVDAGGDDVQLLLCDAEHLRDLPVAALHAVAQADCLHPAVVVGGPGEHRHRVGVVEQSAPGLRHLADVPADAQDHRDAALAVHHAAGRQGIADALVDAVVQRNVDIGGERLDAADPHRAEHVASARYGFTAVGGGAQPYPVKAVGADVPLRQLADHVEVLPADVGQCHFERVEFRDGEKIAEQLAGETDAAGANECDLEGHGRVAPARHRRRIRTAGQDGFLFAGAPFGRARSGRACLRRQPRRDAAAGQRLGAVRRATRRAASRLAKQRLATRQGS